MRFRYFLLFLNLSFSLSVFSLTTIFLSFLLFSIFLSLSSCCLYRGYSSLNLVHILPGAHISLRGPCVLWSIYHSVVHVSVCGTYYITHSWVHILLRGPYVGLWSIALLHRPHKQDHNLHGPAGALGECAPLESRGQTSVQPWGDDPPAQSECRRTGPEPSGVSCKFLDSETPRDISLVKQLRIIVCSSF